MGKHKILCGIFGDIIGSRFESFDSNFKSKDFELFNEESAYTDDTVCTIAIMRWLSVDMQVDLAEIMRCYCRNDIHRGYGGMFRKWILDPSMNDYNSFGNGSGMRSAPVGWYAKTKDECMEISKKTAMITHSHPEGIKGAQAVALSVFLAKNGEDKENIEHEIAKQFGYNMSRFFKDIRQNYKFDVTCQGSVPESIISFLDSASIEDAVRNAVSLGGDSDTQAIMAGAIAEAYYHSKFENESTYDETLKRIPQKYIDVIDLFNNKLKEREVI